MGNYEKRNFAQYILKENDIDFLDMLDFVFNKIDVGLRKVLPKFHTQPSISDIVDKAIEEFNCRFKQHNLGYKFVNGEVIRIDNKMLYQEVIKPALRLLYEEGFDGAEED